ncbi:unnamed protein product [Boreogadus saida]
MARLFKSYTDATRVNSATVVPETDPTSGHHSREDTAVTNSHSVTGTRNTTSGHRSSFRHADHNSRHSATVVPENRRYHQRPLGSRSTGDAEHYQRPLAYPYSGVC